MESVIIAASASYEPELWARLIRMGASRAGQEKRLVLDAGTSRIFVTRDGSALDEMEPEHFSRIAAAIDSPVLYSVDFTDIELCKRLLLDVLDYPGLLVDNDHGLLVTGEEFVQILRRHADWDWRTEAVDPASGEIR